ncbi:MAG: transposase [Oscillospiraceae bacterium]|nr:transposase [Oscillospiraceae bacterium]
MPRKARVKSESGVYHIMLRGINQQLIFEEKEDYLRFIETLEKYKAISEYKIFAYCLMPNHIHLLIKTEKEDLDLIIKRIAGSYVYWYNWTYHRIGHLFQDRYKSEPIEDDSYFLTVLRYIHQNPLKAGIVKEIEEYEFSSYNDYIGNRSELIDIDFTYSVIKKDKFIDFNKENNNDICLDIHKQEFRLSDKEAKEIIKKITGYENAVEIQLIDQKQRNMYIKEIKKEGLSIRQISRLTGISKGIVEKIK